MENQNKNNLELWNRVCKTDPFKTKKVDIGGHKITAINAQYQIRNATEIWGEYGKAWGLKDIEKDYLEGLENNQILATSKAVFYYPDGSFEIGSSIFVQRWVNKHSYHSIDDDFVKKMETDMLTKALSKLGFNADVFLGMFDDNKYLTKLKEEFATQEQPELPWFNPGSEEWKRGVDKKVDINTVKEHYRISKKNEEEYLKEIG